MNEEQLNNRFMEIEIALDHQQKALDDLSDMVVKQGHMLDILQKQNQALQNLLNQDIVKPLSEETPPPHY